MLRFSFFDYTKNKCFLLTRVYNIGIMAKLLATDLDGTLFFPRQTRRCIPKKNVKFLQKWIDQGNRAVLITSRSSKFLERLTKEIQRPVDFLACSSAEIIVDGKLIKESFIDNQLLTDLLNDISKKYNPLAYMLTTKDYPLIIKQNKKVNVFFKLLYKLYYFFQFKYREDYVMDSDVFDEQLANGKCLKVMVVFGIGKSKNQLSKEINKALRERFPIIEASWSDIVIELTPKGCSKGDGLEYYCNAQNIDSKDVYVVGDSGNDIAMFTKFHENSYCMAHAFTSVRKYAKNAISRVYNLDKIVLEGEK